MSASTVQNGAYFDVFMVANAEIEKHMKVLADANAKGDVGIVPVQQKQAHYDANDYIVKEAPGNVCYIPGFISAVTERFLLNKVGMVDESTWNENLSFSGKSVVIGSENNFPNWFKSFVDPVAQIENLHPDKFQLDSVAFHKYEVGTGSVAHRDVVRNRPMHWILSLGSSAVINFFQSHPENVTDGNGQEIYLGSILMEPRSLLVLKDDAGQLDKVKLRECDTIHDKVFNLPAGMQVGTKLSRGQRVVITNAVHFYG